MRLPDEGAEPSSRQDFGGRRWAKADIMLPSLWGEVDCAAETRLVGYAS